MRHARCALAVMVILFAAAGCSAPNSPGSPAAPSVGNEISATLASLTNAERVRARLLPLAANARLMAAAQIQADQTAAVGQLEHELPGARYPRLADRLAAVDYQWQTAGENLGSGQPAAADALEAWMRSPEHLANILSAGFVELGTGFAIDASGRPYYVQVFARPAR